MPVPIIKHVEMLIASMQSNLDDQDLMQLKDEIAEKVGRFKSRGVVLDVSILDVLDSFATRTLQSIAETARLRGAETVIVGIQPDVAIAMVQLGLTLDGVLTALDFEEGMELLLASIGGSRPGGS
jgi:rsbT antagonist protein RsbS